MSVFQLNGINRIGNELNSNDLLPEYEFAAKRLGNKNYQIGKAVAPLPIINGANQPSTLRKVLGKMNFNSVIVANGITPDTDGMLANQGYGRHQNKGLAFTKSIDGPLLPLASSQFGFLNSKIPQPN